MADQTPAHPKLSLEWQKMRFFKFKRRPKYYRLQFFMRSGNTFIIDRVHGYELKSDGPKVTCITVNQENDGTGTTLVVAALTLSQIEAVVRLPN